MPDARHYHRIPFHANADLLIDGSVHPCELIDIALRGALLKTNRPLTPVPEQPVVIKITLADSTLILTFGAVLIHQQDDLYGFEFASEDVETLAHLRRLLELNFGDAQRAEEEFAYWLKKDC